MVLDMGLGVLGVVLGVVFMALIVALIAKNG